MLKTLTLLCLLPSFFLGQSRIPNDTLTIGRNSSTADKGIIINRSAGDQSLLLDNTAKLKFSGDSLGFGADDDSLLKAIESLDAFQLKQDNLYIGSGTDAKEIRFGEDTRANPPAIRHDPSAGLQFRAHEGASFQNFGTGSGGSGGGDRSGINLVENPSFEGGVNVDWEVSISDISATVGTYSSGRPGNLRFATLNVTAGQTATNDSYRSENTITIPVEFSRGCELTFSFKSNNSDWKVAVNEGGSNIRFEQDLATTNDTWRTFPVSFIDCAPAETFSVNFISKVATPGTLNIDSVYFGSPVGVVPIQHRAHYIGSKSWSAGSCRWDRSSTMEGEFTPTSCANGGTTGQLTAGNGQRLEFRIPRVVPGRYRVIFTSIVSSEDSLRSDFTYRIKADNATGGGYSNLLSVNNVTSGSSSPSQLIFDVEYDDSYEDVEFTLVGRGLTSGRWPRILSTHRTRFDVYYFPTADQVAEDAYNPDQTGFYNLAKISSGIVTGPNINVNATESNFTDISSSALSLTNEVGSTTLIPGKIGVSWGLNTTGLYNVCIDTTMEIYVSGGQNVVDLKLAQVASATDNTVIAETHTESRGGYSTNWLFQDIRLCLPVRITKTGTAYFKLLKRQAIYSNSATSHIRILSNKGISFSIEKINNALPSPVLLHSVNTVGAKRLALDICRVNKTADTTQTLVGCSDWVSSVSGSATGVTTVNFISGVFGSLVPRCFLTGIDSTGPVIATLASLTSSSAQIKTVNNSGTALNTDYTLVCVGNK